MKVIAVCGQKGGIGKTSVSMNLAAAMSKHSKILVMDVDPQGSTMFWAETADDVENELPFDTSPSTDPEALRHLKSLNEYDAIIVDTPGSLRDEDVLGAVLDLADFAILPITTSTLDFPAITRTLNEFVIPRGVPYKLLLNKVDTRRGQKRLDGWKQAIDEGEFVADRIGVPRFNHHIRLSSTVEDMPMEGKVVTQYTDTRANQNAIFDYTAVALELTAQWYEEAKAN
ncbi:chromosome partitioning protein [Microbacterium proteolyticum]|uniref:Chromosome partitioning protein n=1 Tax=Microbacterium proteolyticum TaxID=1572644 RepID=A0A7W5CKR4_9MICO|nr:ParA family protein [uncultured Microbacterium sp.]MBB3159498.1 chromosome partitioning protein [Microbacterium proteolyticum]